MAVYVDLTTIDHKSKHSCFNFTSQGDSDPECTMLEGEGREGWPFSGQPISWNWVTADDVARVQMGTENRPITVMCRLVNNPTWSTVKALRLYILG